MIQYYYDNIKLTPWIDFRRTDFKKQDFYSKTLRIIMFVQTVTLYHSTQLWRIHWSLFIWLIFDWCAGSWHIAYWVHIAYCILSAALSTASSFRIWNSSTGILSLPVASVRNSARDKGHEEGGLAYAKAGSSLRSPPSTPKTRVCLLSALCFHLHLWLYGGLSPTTSLWKKELAYSSS